MGKIAFCFPGQGSQAVGMGRELLAAGGSVAEPFALADQVLGYPLTRLMQEGPESELTLTRHTQPALVTTALAAYQLVCEQTPLRPDYLAGHSLGEYAAVCAAGGFDLATAIKLVAIRGQAMQEAVPPGVGGMAALLNLELSVVEEVCRLASEERGQVCVPANYNTSAQVVISGHLEAVERAIQLAKERGGKRCVMLQVSAPFHSPLMQPAATVMAQALAATPLADLTTPVVANVTAREITKADEVRRLLVKQVTGAVRWEESIQRLVSLGVDTFVELGTGKVLAGMIKRCAESARIVTINRPEDVAQLAGL